MASREGASGLAVIDEGDGKSVSAGVRSLANANLNPERGGAQPRPEQTSLVGWYGPKPFIPGFPWISTHGFGIFRSSVGREVTRIVQVRSCRGMTQTRISKPCALVPPESPMIFFHRRPLGAGFPG